MKHKQAIPKYAIDREELGRTLADWLKGLATLGAALAVGYLAMIGAAVLAAR